ncbi:MAG: DUF2203 domain-containing protein [Actinomycetota bacterium]
MGDKVYSIEEANSLLPYIAPALVELREKYEEAAKIRAAVAQAAVTNGGSHHRESWSRTIARVSELFERLEEWELQLRDIETGLIDFPSRFGDEEVWLCWRLGEPSVAYWHRRDEGFSGRQPL